jgi:hypothetical protein
MKRIFPLSPFAFVTVLIMSMLLSESRAQDNSSCFIAEINNGQIASLSEANWNISISVQDYSLSPSHSHIAVSFDAMASETKIGIYLVKESGLQVQALLENVRFIRGHVWSDNGNKLLLQDSRSDHLIYVFDLEKNQLTPLTDTLLPALQIYQVVWMTDDQEILFAAIERPFPTTEFGRNDVIALYRMDTSTFDLSPVSQPNENVDWYFDNFVALSNNRVVYSGCSVEDSKSCKLRTVDSGETSSIQGNYKVIESISQDKLLLYESRKSSDDEELEFEIFILDILDGTLTSILTIPAFSDFPLPFISMSPDKSKLSYMADETGLAIYNIHQMTSRMIASLPSPSTGKWHPNSNELLYWTDDIYYVYQYNEDETYMFHEAVQADLSTEAVWLCE